MRLLSTIRATVTDQKLVITDAPELASGGKGTNHVAFEFCELWDGFTKTAVFYNRPSEKYIMALGSDDVCDVPPEVTEKKGRMFFGVFGIDGDGKRKTSGVVPYFIGEGGYDEDAAPSEPTEEFWEQVLAEIAKSEEAVREAKDALEEMNEVIDGVNKAVELSKSHAVRHSLSGEDPLYPGDIGAARQEHTHDAYDIEGMMESYFNEEEETLELGDLFEYEDEKFYTPFVDNAGTLSWTASVEGMPDVPRANIKGPQGEKPIKYVDYWTLRDKEEIVAEAVPLIKEGAKGDDGKSAYQYAVEGGYTGTEEEFYEDLALSDERFEKIESDIADLKYIAISVSSFGHDAGTKEKGDKVSSVVLSWVLNKEPVSLTVAGQTVTPAKSGSITVTDEISETKTFSLLATDERAATATKSTTINFYDGIYYGTAAKPDEVDSEFILSLTKILASGKNRTVNVSGGEGLYFFYAYPASLGDSIFNVGGFDYEFESETVSFENKFGVIKDYIVYVSDNPMLSNNSVTVKEG